MNKARSKRQKSALKTEESLTGSAQKHQGRPPTEDDMCWLTECGGFKTCPQIFRNTSSQEVRLHFPPVDYGLDLATHLLGRQK